VTPKAVASSKESLRAKDVAKRTTGYAPSVHCQCRPRNLDTERRAMDPEIDLAADLNAEDDEGLGWSVLSEARDPSRVRPGAMLVAGNQHARAVVRVVAVDEDGQVHFSVLPGSLEKNRHLIGRALA
jgi:hypothetical protein